MYEFLKGIELDLLRKDFQTGVFERNATGKMNVVASVRDFEWKKKKKKLEQSTEDEKRELGGRRSRSGLPPICHRRVVLEFKIFESTSVRHPERYIGGSRTGRHR